jgi:cobalt-zinc-cadmium efflux system outer membrane protein
MRADLGRCFGKTVATALCFCRAVAAQPFTWDQVKARFEANNPTLSAARAEVNATRAQEITAYLRPNPDFTLSLDQFQIFPVQPYQPLSQVTQVAGVSYLHERQHKRELRRESAQGATSIAQSQQEDTRRNLLFSLRGAFIQALQAKAVLENARENLTYYDRQLEVNRARLQSGDISQLDLSRLQLQRIQFESDLQTATVNLRTAKIQMLALLNDRTPLDNFDVTGPFDFDDRLPPPDEARSEALESRPDLKAAVQSLEKAKTDHRLAIANGSADPTFGVDGGRFLPVEAYVGVSVNIPLRIFDRNQGEKARTEVEIGRNQKLVEAARTQVFSEVDSAYATLDGTLTLLRPYRTTYLNEARNVRETVSFAYQRGAASLLEYLDAQKSYRDVRLNYLNLVGSYLNAANQLNLVTGREVLP